MEATAIDSMFPKFELAPMRTYLRMLAKVRLPSSTPSATTSRSEASRIMSAAACATPVAPSTDSPISEQSLRRATEELYNAATINDNHGIRHRVQNGTEMALPGSKRLFRLLLLIDVEHNSAKMTGLTVLAVDKPAARANPMTGPWRSDEPVLDVEITSGLSASLYRHGGMLTVHRFEKREKELVIEMLVGRQTEKRSGPIGEKKFLRREV